MIFISWVIANYVFCLTYNYCSRFDAHRVCNNSSSVLNEAGIKTTGAISNMIVKDIICLVHWHSRTFNSEYTETINENASGKYGVIYSFLIYQKTSSRLSFHRFSWPYKGSISVHKAVYVWYPNTVSFQTPSLVEEWGNESSSLFYFLPDYALLVQELMCKQMGNDNFKILHHIQNEKKKKIQNKKKTNL